VLSYIASQKWYSANFTFPVYHRYAWEALVWKAS
jgi:hypothetical protein